VLPALADLELEWRELERYAQSSSFFLSWHWIGTLLHMLPEASRPSLLRVCSNRRTIALALLGERVELRRYGLIRSRALYLNETGDPQHNLSIEYNDLIGYPDCRQPALDGLIDWFSQNARDFDEFHINGSSQSISKRLSNRRNLQFREVVYPTYQVDRVALEADTGEIFPALSRNARQQLRRSMRYYKSFGELELRRACSVAEAQKFFGEMKRLHIASWERRGRLHSFSNPFFEQFHRLLIERSFNDGVIELVCASAGSQVAGFLYNFRYGRCTYAYQSGFAYDEHGARPGAVTHALAIREAYRSGAAVYDFLAGWNRLKQDFATRDQPMCWTTIHQPRLAFLLEAIGRQAKHRMFAYPGAYTGSRKTGAGRVG